VVALPLTSPIVISRKLVWIMPATDATAHSSTLPESSSTWYRGLSQPTETPGGTEYTQQEAQRQDKIGLSQNSCAELTVHVRDDHHREVRRQSNLSVRRSQVHKELFSSFVIVVINNAHSEAFFVSILTECESHSRIYKVLSTCISDKEMAYSREKELILCRH